MTVLVTGGRGAIARAVTAGLIAAGQDVRVASREPSALASAVAYDPSDPAPALRDISQVFLYSDPSTAPVFDFKVENRTIALSWRNLSEVTVNYYLIDPEFSFSSNPFVSEDASRFAIIRPTQTAVLTLPKDKDSMEVPLPGEFAKANVVIEIVAAGQRRAQAYHANTLKMNVAENYGRLELREQSAGKPVPKAYVKVYARLNNGTVRFFKDGYTDLRGKFDYASLNSPEVGQPQPAPIPVERGNSSAGLDTQMLQPSELDQVTRLSILVLSDANGALVKDVAPPRE